MFHIVRCFKVALQSCRANLTLYGSYRFISVTFLTLLLSVIQHGAGLVTHTWMFLPVFFPDSIWVWHWYMKQHGPLGQHCFNSGQTSVWMWTNTWMFTCTGSRGAVRWMDSLSKMTGSPLNPSPHSAVLTKPAVEAGWIIETQTTDQSEAPAQQFHCLCTGLMRDLLTFPTGAVNSCLSVYFQDWLSVWSEQLPAKCVCQLRRSPPPSLLP